MRKHKEYRYVIIILMASFLISACFLYKTSTRASGHDVVFVLKREEGGMWQEDVAQIQERLALFMGEKAYTVTFDETSLSVGIASQEIEDLPSFQDALYFYVFAQTSRALIDAKQNSSLIITRHALSAKDITACRYEKDGQYQINLTKEAVSKAQQTLETDTFSLLVEGSLKGLMVSHTCTMEAKGDVYRLMDTKDSQGDYHEAFVYLCTHTPLSKSYTVTMTGPIDWEVPGFSLTKKMQKKEAEISEGCYIRLSAALGEKATDATWRDAIKALKKRLEARGMPYALGYDSFDGHTIIIKTAKDCLNGNIITLLTLDDATPVLYDAQGNRYIDVTEISYEKSEGRITCQVNEEDLAKIRHYGTKAYFVVHDICWGLCESLDATTLSFSLIPDAYDTELIAFLKAFKETTYSLEIVWTLISAGETEGIVSDIQETCDSDLAQYPDVKAHVLKQAKALSQDNRVLESLMKEKTLIIQIPITVDEHMVETIQTTFAALISLGRESYLYNYDITFASGENVYRLTYYHHTWHVYLHGDDMQSYKTQLQDIWNTELLKGDDNEV